MFLHSLLHSALIDIAKYARCLLSQCHFNDAARGRSDCAAYILYNAHLEKIHYACSLTRGGWTRSHDPRKNAINGALGKWWTSSVHRLIYHSCTLAILVNVSRKLEEASKIVSISSVQRKQVRTEC